jgi:hypothetical protein
MVPAMNTTRHTFAALAGALLAGGLLVACGDGGDPDAEVASLGTDAATEDTTDGTAADDGGALDPEEAMLEFAECMRDHGVDMPDPQTDGNGRGMIAINGEADDPEFQEAQEACQPIMDEAMGDFEIDPEREAEMREELLAFSECMREHGIDMPDPVFSDSGGARVEMEAPASGDVPAFDDEEFQAAAEECNRGDGMVMSGPVNRAGADGNDTSEGGDGG